MDFKGINKIPTPQFVKTKPVDKTIKSETAHDREGNGQMPQGGGEEHPPMTDEQFKKAVEHLKNLAVVKEQNLQVVITESEGKRFVVVQEQNGKILRRIPEAELWSLKDVKDSEKGQLLSKAA